MNPDLMEAHRLIEHIVGDREEPLSASEKMMVEAFRSLLEVVGDLEDRVGALEVKQAGQGG